MIAAARGIDAVIAGDDGDLAAGDEHLGTLQPLVAAGNINGAAGDGEGIIGMHAVIAGGDDEAAAGDGDIAIGVDGVIAAIELEGTAGNGDLRPGLEALGAGVIGDALTRAARGGHGGGAAADGQSGLRLDAVLARGEFERGAGDDEIAQGGIAVIGGAQGIPAAGDGDVSILDGQTILAVDAVIDGGDGDGGLLDEEGILAGDTIIIVGIDRQAAAARKSDFERGELNKDKTGVRLEGIEVTNPATGKVVPMFVSDYVLMSYGTGIVMGVPGHDQRDWDFATKFGLPIVEVVKGGDITKGAFTLKDDTGIMVNSGFLDGMTVKEAIPAMKQYAIDQGWGHEKVNYKLRDWVFSRQRYWGEPIPMVSCPKCGWVPVPEDQLPVVLPQVESYEPTDDGESPLSKMTDWVNTTCPCCGGPAKRETDTMPQWAGSSWYFLRYMDPHDDQAPVSKEAEQYWGPVDWYNGGMEHTTLHLLYSRFWHKFLYDIGVVHTKEPYAKRTSHGMILGQNPHYVGNVSTEAEKQALIEKYGNQALRPAVKMSKSLGNVVNPDDVVKAYGADTMRLYIMFIGDFEKTAVWSDDSVRGCKRFLDRVWNLATEQEHTGEEYSKANEAAVHKAIKKVSEDIEAMKFNTAIAALMSLVNDFYAKGLTKGDLEQLLLLLSPFVPHIVEEMWEQLGFAAKYGKMAMQMPWPEYDESKTVAAHTEMAVQVNGKLKGTVTVAMDSEQDAVVEAARQVEKIAKALDGMQIVKVIFVKNKLINLIAKPQ